MRKIIILYLNLFILSAAAQGVGAVWPDGREAIRADDPTPRFRGWNSAADIPPTKARGCALNHSHKKTLYHQGYCLMNFCNRYTPWLLVACTQYMPAGRVPMCMF